MSRPGLEPGTPSIEARHDVRFTTGAKERKARDLNPHGLAAARFSRPARQPVSGYPPYRVDPAGVEPALLARQAGVVPLDHRPRQVIRGVGVEPTLSGSQGRRITAFLPPAQVDRRGIAPRFPPCDGGVFLLDEQPQRGPAGGRTRSSALTRAACGRNTSRPRSCGGRIRTGVGTAYETVLGTRLPSTPQYPRQDSNLR